MDEMFVYCMKTDSKIRGCYMSLYRVKSWNCTESYQLYYQIYSSQQVRELYPRDIKQYWILNKWKISMVSVRMLFHSLW